MSLKDKLLVYAENNFNVMLIGEAGIGKSTIVKEIAEQMAVKFKYYSSSTLDPWADLVGIPVPDKELKTLQFYRPFDLEESEFIFFDELNRAHPRVLNAVLEIIQFKSINGRRLENLRMVWAAINPPGGDYQVEDLDPVLVDRFHLYVKMRADINLDYMKTKMNKDTAVALKGWWNDDLDEEQKRLLTPRRIEYMGMLIDKKIPWKDTVPCGHPFPRESLARRLRILNNEEEDFILDKKNIIAKKDILLKRIKEAPKDAIKIAQQMTKFNEKQLFECRDLMEAMPKELVVKVGDRKFVSRRRQFYDMFKKNAIDIKNYPKISEAFDFKSC